MKTTKVLSLINSYGIFPQNWKTEDDVDQTAIDAIQGKILAQLTAADIAEHNDFAYSNSVAAYDSKEANSKAVPELPIFIDLMPDNGLVLDLGAGHLRDTLYMVDPSSREGLHREKVDYKKTKKALNVIPFEKSFEFIDKCYHKIEGFKSRIPIIILGDFMSPQNGFLYEAHGDTEESNPSQFDGIWSCAAFMVHMAPGKLEESIKVMIEELKPGGIFAVSYINKKEGQSPMKFLASRSAPGEIKIFSHFTPEEVDKAFAAAGLKLINTTPGDYDGHGHIMKGFFNTAFYRKV